MSARVTPCAHTAHQCRLELQLSKAQFVEKGQRFTLRTEGTTIGTGVVVDLLPNITDEEKDSKHRKKLMRMEIERLGFWFGCWRTHF